MAKENNLKTLITFQMETGVLNSLEYTASANCELVGEDITADNTNISVYIPGFAGRGSHISVTHLISEAEIENITDKIIEAFWIRHDSSTKSTDKSANA